MLGTPHILGRALAHGSRLQVAREIEVLKECDCANIVRYYGSVVTAAELWIVMEFCAGSSLCDIMEARERCLTEQQISAAVAGTLSGLLYLHNQNKIHRDVKVRRQIR